MHHPFTAPDLESPDSKLDTATAKAYDLVYNGYEIGGVPSRLHGWPGLASSQAHHLRAVEGRATSRVSCACGVMFCGRLFHDSLSGP